jgi:hypothetical protein
VDRTCDLSNEATSAIKGVEFFDQLSHQRLIKEMVGTDLSSDSHWSQDTAAVRTRIGCRCLRGVCLCREAAAKSAEHESDSLS